MAKHAGGRPKSITKEVLGKLEEAFIYGATDSMACLYAGIHESTLYDYCKDNPKFSERKAALKNMPEFNALRNQFGALDAGCMKATQSILDRLNTKKIKHDLTSGGKPLNNWTVIPVTTEKNG